MTIILFVYTIIVFAMRLGIIPSEFLLARRSGDHPDHGRHGHEDDIVAAAVAEYEIGAPSFFAELQDEMHHLLRSPFDDINSYINGVYGVDGTGAGFFDTNLGDTCVVDEWYDGLLDNDNDDGTNEGRPRKQRSPNLYPYSFGNVYEANWYRQYLKPEVRDRTYALSSRDRFGEFRAHFRMPLAKVDDLVERFLDEGWIHLTKHCSDVAALRVKAELLVLGALSVLGHHTPFCCLRSDTEISTSEHRAFFHDFIDCMYTIREEYIFYPRSPEELQRVMDRYVQVYLPGCGGSMDVVHLKWYNCPAGDRNRCTGKEGYPTVAFQCISGFDRSVSMHIILSFCS